MTVYTVFAPSACRIRPEFAEGVATCNHTIGGNVELGMDLRVDLQVSPDEILSAMQQEWERLTVAWLDVTLAAVEPLELPSYKGSTFRGAFGWAFQKVSCLTGWPSCSGCSSRSICAYAQVFEATVPSGSHPPLEGLQGITRPFVLRPPLERKQTYQPGERLRVELLLFGPAIPLTPLFIRAFMFLAAQGVGRGRRRARVERVEARLPGQVPVILFEGGDGCGDVRSNGPQAINGTRSFHATLGEWLPGGANTTAGAGAKEGCAKDTRAKSEPVSIDFVTMTRLKHDGRLVRSGPPFAVLVASLLRRISTLMWYLTKQDHAWPSDGGNETRDGEEGRRDNAFPYRQLVKKAEEVQLIEADTRWTDWERFSHRQQQHMSLGGLMGRAVYSEAAQLFLPLLRVGEIVHVGKGSTFGLGQYRLAIRSADRGHA